MKDIIQFNKYSDYYDLFYQKKDYQAEVKFLRAAIAKHSNRKVKSILSLGCGTAGHDIILAKQGFKMTSVDFSKRMLDLAKIKAKKQGAAIDFVLGDVRKVKIKKKFDLVVAMFNIAGYQNSNSDIVDFMATAARHLNKGGLFIFDAWYQPAVLLDPPHNLIKKIELANNHFVTRETQQTVDIKKSLVNINFIFKEVIGKKIVKQFSEAHPMRFFTYNEIDLAIRNQSLALVKMYKIDQLKEEIDETSWNMSVIIKKV